MLPLFCTHDWSVFLFAHRGFSGERKGSAFPDNSRPRAGIALLIPRGVGGSRGEALSVSSHWRKEGNDHAIYHLFQKDGHGRVGNR